MKKERQTAEQRFMMNLALKIYQANPGWRPWAVAKKVVRIYKENNIPLAYKSEMCFLISFVKSSVNKPDFTND